jgi:hypothetical protein
MGKKNETYPYVVKKTTHFEIKLQRQVCLRLSNSQKEFKEASSQGFSILVDIFFGNKENEKIAMTSPVTMSLEDSMTVFMVPKNLIKKRFQSQANRRSNFDKNQQNFAAITLAVGLMKIEKYKD